MNQLYDYHIHSIYCDGNDTPEQMVVTAIEKGFKILGFSSHKYYEGDENNLPDYCKEVNRLKEKYKNDIDILLGIEQDYFSTEPTDRFDYVIGSVHYLKEKDESQLIDLEISIVEDNIKNNYGGNYSLFAKDYFALVGDVVNKTDADIIGHFDLCTKYKNNTAFIVKNNKEQIKMSYERLLSDVKRLANGILSKNLTDCYIAVSGKNSYNWMVSALAVFYSGNILVPIDGGLSEEEFTRVIGRSNASMLIYSKEITEKAGNQKSRGMEMRLRHHGKR